MDVSIKFDRPEATYTNGETVYGNVEVYCKSTVTLSRITVTLSGKSISIVSGNSGFMLYRKSRISHGIVHETQDITPHSNKTMNMKCKLYKLNFGYHSFPFQLNIPWLAKCSTCPAGGSGDLPSSMHDVIKGAEVLYKVEASVTSRGNMLKATVAKIVEINVWPLDTRPMTVSRTISGSFPCTSGILVSVPGVTNRSNLHQQGEDLIHFPSIADPAQILVEARFPEDYSLTCGNDVAMSLIIRKMSAFPGSLLLQSFQMLLIGYTEIGAWTDTHVETGSWMIQSLSNLNLHISDADDTEGSEMIISNGLWGGQPLPMSVIPSFKTCNVGRRYELELSMGFQCEAPRGRVKLVQHRLPVQVFSGILPGKHLAAEKNYSPQPSTIDITIQMDDPSTRGLSHRRESNIVRPVSRVSQENRPASPPLNYGSPPPTYAHAILTSVNDGLRKKSL